MDRLLHVLTRVGSALRAGIGMSPAIPTAAVPVVHHAGSTLHHWFTGIWISVAFKERNPLAQYNGLFDLIDFIYRNLGGLEAFFLVVFSLLYVGCLIRRNYHRSDFL
jgi:hypothetical protein